MHLSERIVRFMEVGVFNTAVWKYTVGVSWRCIFLFLQELIKGIIIIGHAGETVGWVLSVQ